MRGCEFGIEAQSCAGPKTKQRGRRRRVRVQGNRRFPKLLSSPSCLPTTMTDKTKVTWISGSQDLSSSDLQILLCHEDKFVIAKSGLGIQIFNVKTGRVVNQIFREALDDKVDWIWQHQDSDRFLALTGKHLLGIRVPQGQIVSKIPHPSHYKV